ncbi:epimerase [Bacillus pseudomycoides]|uniref:epimerase n=1 Tax=Bacillus pseudomycoides TaxID=64104 RepID=UPI000BFCC759|nr:epimerase [Bacillus pseudomycoides]PGS03270.1 epimerase [Bacillus pseudomycoides]
MNQQNNNKTSNITAVLIIVSGLVLPIFLPAFLMLILEKWMPDQIVYPGILSLFILSFELFILAGIFTKILSFFGLSEKKIDELGFLGFTISGVTSFLAIYVGYFWMSNIKLTSVELSPNSILIIAIISTIISMILLKVLNSFDISNEENTNE